MKKLILVLLFLLVAGNSFCFEGEGWKDYDGKDVPEGIPNMVGFGAVIRDEPYRGMDVDILPLPMFALKHERFYLRGATAGYTVWENDPFKLDAIVKARFMGYEEDDSGFLDGMGDRNFSIDGGLKFTWKIRQLSNIELSASAVTDLLSEHEGQEAKVSLSKKFKFWPIVIEPGINVEWQSQDLVDYYYGVRSGEVRAQRGAYFPGEAINISPELALFVPLSRKWLVFCGARVDFLDDEITDSPIVDKDYTVKGIVGLEYMF